MNNLFKYLTATLLIAIPLYPKFPLINVPGTFVSIRLEDLLMLLAFLLVGYKLITLKNKINFLNNKINRAIIIYLIVGLLSVFTAVLITKTAPPSIAILHWLRRVEYFVPFLLGYFAIRNDKRNLNFFVNTILIVCVITLIYGIGQKYYSWPIIITQNEEYSKGIALRYVPGGHINSTFAGHYDLGTFLILVLPLFVSIFAYIKTRIKFLYGIGFLGGLWLLVNSASRISLVSCLIASLLALVIIKRKKVIPLVIVFTLLFAFTSDNLVARYKRIIEVSTQKIEQFNPINYIIKTSFAQEQSVLPNKKTLTITPTSIPVFEDRSSNIRLNVEWPRAIRAFSKNPLLGTGYSSITLATDNDYLRLLGEVGLLGFVAFMLILFQLINSYLKRFPFESYLKGLNFVYIAAMFSSLPGVLINAVFIDVFEASKFAIMFWLLMGISVGLLKRSNYQKPN